MLINSSGNVGIGTTSPNTTIDVNGTGRFRLNGPNQLVISTEGGNPYIFSEQNAPLHFGTNSQIRATIDSSGRLLVGTSSASTGTIAQYSKLQILGNTSSSASGAQLNLGRNETSVNVANNELLGGIHFTDNQAGEYAFIEGRADGTPGVGDYPGRLVFSTTAAGASSPTERMRIKNDGTINFSNVAVYADNTAALAGGLVAGDVYRKSDGTLMITY